MKEFNYKKVVVILAILLVMQIIIYAITNAVVNNKKATMQETVDTPVSNLEDREFLKRTDLAYADKEEEIINPENLKSNYTDKFKCVVTLVDFQKSLYKLVNEGFPLIYNETNGKSREEVSNFYKTDYARINSCGIMDEENYLYIEKELLDQIYKGNNTFDSVEMDYESVKQNQNGYMTIDFKVNYTGSATINMTAFLAEREGVLPKIKFRSNSNLKKLFEKYKGEITPNDFTENIKKLADNIIKINSETTMKSINYRKSYYKENKEKFNQLGIATENDFLNLVRAINNETLISDNFYSCVIKLDSIQEFDDRYEVKVDLEYIGAQVYNLKVKMYKAKNEEGRLMEFQSSLYDENYSDTNEE